MPVPGKTFLLARSSLFHELKMRSSNDAKIIDCRLVSFSIPLVSSQQHPTRQ
jgi:hypothetical protein